MSDWYANSRWDADARADFDARIRRARKGEARARAFIVKARFLWVGRGEEPPREGEALALLARAAGESDGDGGVAAEVHEELARFQLAAGDRAAGIASLRCAIEAAAPDPRRRRGAAEALLARCLVDDGDFADAIRVFHGFYSSSPTRPRYESLEAREVVGHDGRPHAHPDEAAEFIVTYYHAGEPDEPAVPEVATADLSAVAALDLHFAIVQPKFREPLWRRGASQRRSASRARRSSLRTETTAMICRG